MIKWGWSSANSYQLTAFNKYEINMQKFKKLRIWDRSVEFVTQIYFLTNNFPKHELFGLTSQLRRAATSIPLNIAEGSGNDSDLEFKRFLAFSLRSTYEVISALEVSKRLKYCSADKIDKLIVEADQIAAMISGFMKKLKADSC